MSLACPLVAALNINTNAMGKQNLFILSTQDDMHINKIQYSLFILFIKGAAEASAAAKVKVDTKEEYLAFLSLP